jgi:molybdenum cofactor biosynthesis enzyme
MSTDIAKLLVAQTTDDKTPNEMEAILAASAQKTMPSAYD